LANVDLDGTGDAAPAVDGDAPEASLPSAETAKLLLSAPLSAAIASLEEFRAAYEVRVSSLK